jgi:biofilm PGA synthesis lipoprotein PgaB
MAMPLMEGARDPDRFLDALVAAVAAHPEGPARTLFELQARDWRTGAPVRPESLARWIRRLELSGMHHVGYYPDDARADVPALRSLVPAFSVRSLPQP